MGNTSSINQSLGLFASILGNISVATCGVAAKRTVAIQCRGGRSHGFFFVFDGPIEPGDRYDGMKQAFGDDVEIFKPNRQGDLSHEVLNNAAYNKLLAGVQKRYWARNREVRDGQVANDALRYHRKRPIWNWATEQKYGHRLSILYGTFEFVPLLIFTIVKICMKVNLIPEFIYGVLFLLVKLYCKMLLDVHRDVCYIKVAKTDLEPEDLPRWENLKETALRVPPGDGKKAVEDIKFGYTRVLQMEDAEYLLVPVIKLTPTLSYDKAQWWFIARRFRGPLLTCSYLFAGDTDHRWSVAFAICAFVQASLQDDSARVFLTNTKTFEIHWFRYMEGQMYPEEYLPYSRALE